MTKKRKACRDQAKYCENSVKTKLVTADFGSPGGAHVHDIYFPAEIVMCKALKNKLNLDYIYVSFPISLSPDSKADREHLWAPSS